MKQKRSVGLIIMTIYEEILHVVLQVRGSFNPEKMKRESFPGVHK